MSISIKRRAVLLASVAVLGGVAVGYRSSNGKSSFSALLRSSKVAATLTPYVILDQSGISIIAPRAEMGQGIQTTLAALVAEELDVQIEDVTVIHGPPSELYANDILLPAVSRKRQLYEFVTGMFTTADKIYTRQLTGGQTSIRDAYTKMRIAGATGRHILVAAAAQTWGLDSGSLSTHNGRVLAPDGRKLSYTELAQAAVGIALPARPELKTRDQWTLLGRSQSRADMATKCDGTAKYSIDVRLPDMLYGTVVMNPHLGSAMKSYRAERALAMTGVTSIVPMDNGVIVVATNTWYALRAARIIEFEWDDPAYPSSTAEHRQQVKLAFENEPYSKPRHDGDTEKIDPDADVITGEYFVPYLAHATMEPLNAVAWLREGRLDIWAGTQYPTQAQAIGAKMVGLDVDNVSVHTMYLGGGFGRRLETDFVKTAVAAARELKGTPVKVTWSREEDMSHDAYRPMAVARFHAQIKNSQPQAFSLQVATPSLFSSYRLREDWPEFSGDKSMSMGLWEQPYQIPNYKVRVYKAPDLLPVGWWRSVGESQNTFFHESIIDEIAHAANADPIQMRLDLIAHTSSREVLRTVSEKSGWGGSLPDGHAQGVAYALSSGAATAQVIEIFHDGQSVRVVKVWVAIDVGIALDPRNIEAQVQSSLVFGLSAAINGEITVSNGSVDQTNFDTNSPMRIHQMPDIDVSIIESGTEIYGVGESATPTAAPALGNAIFAATGRRIRSLPFAGSISFV